MRSAYGLGFSVATKDADAVRRTLSSIRDAVIDAIFEQPGVSVLLAMERQGPLDQLAVRCLEERRERPRQRRSDERRERVVGRARRAEPAERVPHAAHDAGARIGERSVEIEEQHERLQIVALPRGAAATGPCSP